MHKKLLCAAIAASAALLPQVASAQSTTGFALDRFNPSERGSEWFSLDTLDFRGHLRPAIGLVGEYANNPLVLYNADGSTRSTIVSDQLHVHVGGSLILADRLRIAVSLPIALVNSGSSGGLGTQTFVSPGNVSPGDLRIGADIRLFGTYGKPITMALGGQVFMPTGQRDQYTGDESARGIIHVLAAGEVSMFAYGARIGVHFRDISEAYNGAPVSTEIIFGASAGVRLLEKKLLVGPELFGATGLKNSDAVFATRTTPLEVLLGGHYTIGSDWRVGLGAGPGLTRGLGEPAFRVLASVEWVPGYKAEMKPDVVGDRDKDGIPDNRDACPDHPGPTSDDARAHGCPPLQVKAKPDRDGDGIPDDEDACPDVKGVKTDDPKTNGCPPPPPDRDGDGIPDAEDACPDVKGIKTNDPKTNGCPPDPDRDKDGIINEEDACPDAPGPKNADPKKNGCPAAAVVGKQIVILDQVKFATGSAVILKESEGIMTAVLKVLTDHPEIKKIRIEGHTDNQGGAAYNKGLSQARAASVMTWLIKHGIDKSRMSSQGFGLEKPIDDNKTDAGRKNNRRVEFHIEEQEGAPPAPPAKP
jgi:outer membrane protein OmpA-like peptidoglycan-associated protein